ncbi:MAG: type II secretion system GspH family protein, partial [Firmicutes bacterium]|nr:type II secretion system GspH family protein [Bacillota bacterium]
MKNKGFTLIELLGVIIILALVAVITTPVITGIIEDSKKETVKRSVENIISAAQIYIANEELANKKVPKGKNIYEAVSKEISGSKPEYAEIISDGIGNIAYAILFRNNCYKKSYDGVQTITEKSTIKDCKIVYAETILNGAYPVLDEKMIAITYTEAGIPKVADESSEWYSYASRKWANAVVL